MNRDDIIRMAEQADEAADRKIKMMVWPDSASVWAMRGEYHPDWHEVRDEAFAALVAAAVAPVCGECGKSAPDLLTALEKCEALALSDDDPEDLLEEVRIAAHAAIALAKGKV